MHKLESGPARDSVQVISRAEAIWRASAYISTDASHLPGRTIKLILEQIPDDPEDIEETPMEIEGGSAPAVLQSTGGVVLGGRHQPPSTGTADDDPPQGPRAQPASGATVEPRNEDTATEDESEPEIIELRPEDSVSQRILPTCTSLHAPPYPPRPLPAMTAPTNVNKAKRPANMRTDLNAATKSSRSGSESDIEIACPSKRQRLYEPCQVSRPSRPLQPCLSTHSSPRAAAPSAASILPPDASNPTPLSDTGGILTKAVQLVEQAGDNAEVLEAEAALELGKHIRRYRKPMLADFPGLRRAIASLSMPKFTAIACTRGAYETFGVFCGWVKEAYESVWARTVLHVPLLKAPQPLKSIIVHHLSWFRGVLKTRICAKIPSLSSLIDPPRTPQDLQVNRTIVKQLLPNNFHCRDMQTSTDPYENPALSMCIAVGFFSGPEPLGMVYKKMFSPLPLPVITMVLTMMQHCLKEWRTGRFIAIELKADRQLKMYDSHLQGLLAYARRAPKRLWDFQADWYEFGRAYAGATPDDNEPYQEIIQAD
ncbi:hypothetical protein FRC06_011893 [Ceratobasidium sp. 370]|nr:hypothetical protein FRC06_011893 [Ceratobasidium sp. 370]